MKPNILILDGHPDPCANRLIHVLVDAYRQGAEQANHEVRVVRLADLTLLIYRWYFRARSLRSLQRNILKFVGFRRVRSTIIGGG